jgi:ribonuclease R
VKKSAGARESGQDIAEPAHEPRDEALPSREDVLAFIAREREAFGGRPQGKIGKREIARAFNVKGPARITLKRMLRDLEGDGAIERRRKSLHKPGGLQGVAMIARDRDGDLARAKNLVLGIFRADPRGGGRIVPIDKKNANRDELSVGPGDEGVACDGDLVAVEVLRTGRIGLPAAMVRERLGTFGNERATSLIAIHAHQIPHVFSPEVIAEAELARSATMAHRDDWRAIPLVTIDPADAKDHDDAVHAARDPNPANPGGFILRIAIADVAAYTRPGTALDREAQERGNSVYFPDRVVPMLPERISNDLCSLRPNEDRPALAARIVVAADGHKLSHSFHRVTMCSAAKLTYAQTQTLIDHGPDEAMGPLHASVLVPLYEAYAALKIARDNRGPLDLDLPERKIILDDKGAVKSIAIPPRLDSHRLIEEFMILANVAATETLEAKHQAFIYRVHDEPSLEKLNNLAEFLASIGIKHGKGQVLRAAQFNGILARVKGTDNEHLVNEIVLRTQAQAEYAIENYGHFGLNLRRYTHFTSPIRRYADLIAHRALISALRLGTDGLGSIANEELAEIAAKISASERRAMAAERETSERLIAAHLAGQIGASFQGRIAGATSAGLFVKLDETGADGFIPATTLGDDYFRHDPARHALIGSRTGQIHRLGDIVTVRLVEAAPLAGALRFELLSENAPRLARPRAAKAKRSLRHDIQLDFESPHSRRTDSGSAKR